MKLVSYKEAIAQSMRDSLRNNSSVIIYGQGITDYTGTFGTTLGLEKEFGSGRVFDTPLSEDAMTGFAVGAALSKLYPIYIHLRNDFMLLGMNQLVNSAAKYKYMYGSCFEVPMLVRGIVGRSWGQGAQHSQSLQALFAHIPGLTVIMPASAQSILDCYAYSVNKYKSPVISLEHRLLYDRRFYVKNMAVNHNPFSSYVVRKGRDITIIATSITVYDAQEAALFVKKNEGIDVEIIDLNCLTHPDINLILHSVKKTKKVMVMDTGWSSYGVCAEVSRIIAVNLPQILSAPIKEMSMAKSPCPTAKILENFFYPNISDIVNCIYGLFFNKDKHNKELPAVEHKKGFKGPF